MAKLHELLAAEKPVTAAWNTLHTETLSKLAKPQMFEGEVVALKISPAVPATLSLKQ